MVGRGWMHGWMDPFCIGRGTFCGLREMALLFPLRERCSSLRIWKMCTIPLILFHPECPILGQYFNPTCPSISFPLIPRKIECGLSSRLSTVPLQLINCVHYTSPCLSFSICEMEIVLPFQGCCGNISYV